MWTRVAPIILGVVVLGAGAVALVRSGAPSEPTPAPKAASDRERPPPPQLPIGQPSAATPQVQMPVAPAQGQGAAITWTVPSDWQTLPNPSPMRLATYRLPAAAGGDPAEMTVARAGGTTDANIDRWRGQFEGASAPKRSEIAVRKLKVTIVELTGTYHAASMMPGAPPSEPHPGWALLAAIIDTPGSPYFFKLVGPASSVKAARSQFDALIASISPS